jgi:hypothetical protein
MFELRRHDGKCWRYEISSRRVYRRGRNVSRRLEPARRELADIHSVSVSAVREDRFLRTAQTIAIICCKTLERCVKRYYNEFISSNFSCHIVGKPSGSSADLLDDLFFCNLQVEVIQRQNLHIKGRGLDFSKVLWKQFQSC